jgi:hypothetical protein
MFAPVRCDQIAQCAPLDQYKTNITAIVDQSF